MIIVRQSCRHGFHPRCSVGDIAHKEKWSEYPRDLAQSGNAAIPESRELGGFESTQNEWLVEHQNRRQSMQPVEERVRLALPNDSLTLGDFCIPGLD